MSLIAVISAIVLMAPSFGTSQNVKSVPTFTSHQSQFILSSDDIENDADYESFAFDSTNVRSVGRWPFGAATAVTYANISGTDYAILGSGGGVFVLDVTNPVSPVKIGQIATPGRISGLFMQNNYLYLTDGTGLRIYNLSNPQSPTELGSCPTSSAGCIFVSGNYAYLGGGINLVIVDISNPNVPSLVNEFETQDLINDIYVQDSFAYVTNDDSGFKVINVVNPYSPQLIGSLMVVDNNFGKLDVFYPYAYVTGSDNYADSLFLKVIDISNSVQPIEVARQNFSYDYYDDLLDVIVRNEFVFVTTTYDLQIFNISQPTNPYLIGTWQGNTGQMAIFSAYLFIAAGGTLGLRIVNIYDPTSPVLAGFIELSGSPRGIAFGEGTNDYAYIASGSAGLRVVSTADPYNLQEIAACLDPTDANDVSVRNTVAYVADGSNGIKAINITDPYQPTLLWQKTIPGNANAIFTYSDKIYVAANDSGLVIMQDSIVLSSINTPENAMDVFVVGRYAYVAADDAGLRIIDVNDPYLPVEIGYCDTIYGSTALYVNGNYAYLASYEFGMVIVDVSLPSAPFMVSYYTPPGTAQKIYVVGQYAFITDDEGNISVVDVSNPALPELINTLHAFDFGAYDIVISGSQAYVTDDDYLFYVFDNVFDFQPPIEIGSFPVPDQILQVDIVGSYAYFANDDDGMRIFDVSNPQNPVEISRFDTPQNVFNQAIRDTFAYLCEQRGLRIVNVTNPSSPFEVGFCSLPDDANSVFLLGGLAYVACDGQGLRIIDISNPANPVEIGFYDTGDATDLFVVDTLAYIADGSYGLRILSVANPNSIYQIGIIDPGRAYAVEVIGNYAYVTTYSNRRLVVIDISNPAAPVQVGSCPTPNYAMDLSISGVFAYVANRSYGMRVIDISSPDTLFEVGNYDTPGRAQGIKTVGNLTYVADYSCGFVILEFLGPGVAENKQIKILPTLNISSNPLRPFSTISYSLPQTTNVHLSLYDITGRQLRLLENAVSKKPGKYDFNIRNLANGIYFLRDSRRIIIE